MGRGRPGFHRRTAPPKFAGAGNGPPRRADRAGNRPFGGGHRRGPVFPLLFSRMSGKRQPAASSAQPSLRRAPGPGGSEPGRCGGRGTRSPGRRNRVCDGRGAGRFAASADRLGIGAGRFPGPAAAGGAGGGTSGQHLQPGAFGERGPDGDQRRVATTFEAPSRRDGAPGSGGAAGPPRRGVGRRGQDPFSSFRMASPMVSMS